MDWSSDGRFLLYESLDPKRGFDIWAMPLAGDRQPFAVVQTDFSDRLPQFSPDGKWVAYQSDKTGRFEIYMRPFPGPGPDARVSIDGGTQVRWDPHGKELFFIAADGRLMSVPVRFPSQDDVEPGRPVGLFATSIGNPAANRHAIRRCSRRPVVRGEFGAQRADRPAHFRDSELEADAVTVTAASCSSPDRAGQHRRRGCRDVPDRSVAVAEIV